MRPLLLALMTALLTAGSASAEPKPAAGTSTWVDPPAKSGTPEPTGETSGAAALGSSTRPGETARSNAPPEAPSGAQADRAKDGPAKGMAEGMTNEPARLEPRRAARESGRAEGGRAVEARQLMIDYLRSISSSNAQTLAASSRFYGTRVTFHGRSMTQAALIAEKRRFLRRWPERRYEPQRDAMSVTCQDTTCRVRTVLGFQAASPARQARSRGVSELVLTVSFEGARPVIVSESSRVLRREAAALDVPAPARYGA